MLGTEVPAFYHQVCKVFSITSIARSVGVRKEREIWRMAWAEAARLKS